MSKWLDAAEIVLREAMERDGAMGLTNQQLFEAIKEKNLFNFVGNTPINTMNASLNVDIKRNPKSLFIKPSIGIFSLKSILFEKRPDLRESLMAKKEKPPKVKPTATQDSGPSPKVKKLKGSKDHKEGVQHSSPTQRQKREHRQQQKLQQLREAASSQTLSSPSSSSSSTSSTTTAPSTSLAPHSHGSHDPPPRASSTPSEEDQSPSCSLPSPLKTGASSSSSSSSTTSSSSSSPSPSLSPVTKLPGADPSPAARRSSFFSASPLSLPAPLLIPDSLDFSVAHLHQPQFRPSSRKGASPPPPPPPSQCHRRGSNGSLEMLLKVAEDQLLKGV